MCLCPGTGGRVSAGQLSISSTSGEFPLHVSAFGLFTSTCLSIDVQV